jgi:ABC-type multidrug transport system ATPase subunit
MSERLVVEAQGTAAELPRAAVVSLREVYGADRQGKGARTLGKLAGVSLDLAAGIHAFVGTPSDGSAALCNLCAGRQRPSGGKLLIAGASPASSPRLRRRIGSLLVNPELPQSGSVADLASRLAGLIDGDPMAALEALGAQALASRRLAGLRRDEARAVELSLALAIRSPLCVVLFEPWTALLPLDGARVRERLRQLAQGGSCVVIATASLPEAQECADACYRLERGRLLPGPPLLGREQDNQELSVWLSEQADAARLVAALGRSEAVTSVRWSRMTNDLVEVRVAAGSLMLAANAVRDAAHAGRVPLLAFEPRATPGASS